jgi:acetyltransferase-like isoleucine patch superfamily enzyme
LGNPDIIYEILSYWEKAMPGKKYLKKVCLSLFSYLPSGFKLAFYRLLGAKIGKYTELGIGSFIVPYNGDFSGIQIGNNVTIGDHVTILCKRLTLGDRCQVKDFTKIWGQSHFSMGIGSYIDQQCYFDLRSNISLGDNSGIGAGSWLYTHGVFHSVLDGAPSRFGPIKVGNNVWIAANVFILPGISVGDKAMVESRSFVTKNVASDSVIQGNPAREIGKVSKISRKLSTNEQVLIMKKILADFMTVHEETMSLKVDKPDETGLAGKEFSIALVLQIPDISHAEDMRTTYNNRLMVLSFDIPEKVRAFFNTHQVFWFDLAEKTRSRHPDVHSYMIAKFLENYGIGTETKDERKVVEP